MKIPLLALLVALPVCALAQTYRWVDESGTVHFTQVPPRTGPYTLIGPPAPPKPAPNQDALNQSLEQSTQDAAKSAGTQAQADAQRAERRERCRQAIERLAYLEAQTPRRMATTNAAGEVVRDDDQQFQERLAAQRKVMKDNCD